jgi:hypothetical protein
VVWGIYNIQVWRGRTKIFKIHRHDLQVGLPHIVEDRRDANPWQLDSSPVADLSFSYLLLNIIGKKINIRHDIFFCSMTKFPNQLCFVIYHELALRFSCCHTI